MKTKKQFILDTLLPYKLNPDSCGFDKQRAECAYLVNDDGEIKNCAVGKHIRKDFITNDDRGNPLSFTGDVIGLFEYFNPKNILTKEAFEQNLTEKEWVQIQKYHDNIASSKEVEANKAVVALECMTGLELKELKIDSMIHYKELLKICRENVMTEKQTKTNYQWNNSVGMWVDPILEETIKTLTKVV